MKTLFKRVYEVIPFKNHFFSLVKQITSLPEPIYKHLHFKGIFSVKLNANQSFKMYHLGNMEENEIFWGGIENGWEKTSLKLWRKLCLEVDYVIDIGANTGLYSLVTKTLNPSAKVYAFEPLPKVIEYLKYNIKLNNFDIEIIPMAASNYTGYASVFLMEKNHDFDNSVCVNKSLLANTTPQKKIEIETITLQNFITNYNIQKIDLIKIDVETHEPEVLEGMGEYLDKFRPDFLIEIWDKESTSKINALFKNKGYLYFDIDDKNDTVTLKEEITISSYWNYLICKPESAKKAGLI